jgi:dethiobiotin synthetase
MNGVFITGSNTGVGKTTVSVDIIKHLRKKRKILARKPVETGCGLVNGSFVPKDAIRLNEACSSGEDIEAVCPFCFELEASPEEASTYSGRLLELDDLVKSCKSKVGDSFVFVEGAGGFYSPIANKALNSDLAAELDLPVIIVVRDELGAVSQSLLTINAAKSQQLKIACVILNEIEPNQLSNAEALRAYTKAPIIEYSKSKLSNFFSEIERLI